MTHKQLNRHNNKQTAKVLRTLADTDIMMNTAAEKRFVITEQGDTFIFVAILTNGDALVQNQNGRRFHIPARTVKGIR